ncbi:MAG: CPBP family intramembrane metalloprotease [Clostridia bacterium]|nr:CPBP family intramembrane metalloprotease [Clostridia bacterium]
MKAIEKSTPNVAHIPRKEGFLPLLLAAVAMLITLIATVIDKFIYPFGGDMLSPALGQIIILLIPTYLCILFLSPEKTAGEQIKALGIGKLHAQYVFFMIFAAMFTVTTSLLLNILFYGVASSAKGFTLLAAFTAGVGEYAVNYPYLITVYVLIPSILEEAVFRGVIFGELKKISLPVAIVLSSLISALFAFTLGGLPAAIFCGLTYCFVRMTTRCLQASMIVHLVYNLYALLLGTNVSAYFLSSQNNTLLIVIILAAWLVSASLFFTEAARLYKEKAEKVSAGEEQPTLPKTSFKKLWCDLLSVFTFKPTAVCAIACAALYVAIMIVCALG